MNGRGILRWKSEPFKHTDMPAMHMDLKQNVAGHDGIPTMLYLWRTCLKMDDSLCKRASLWKVWCVCVCVCLGTCGATSSLTLTFSWLCLQRFWWHVMWTSEACRSVYNRAGCYSDRDLTTAVWIHAFIPLITDLWLRLKGIRDKTLDCFCTVIHENWIVIHPDLSSSYQRRCG